MSFYLFLADRHATGSGIRWLIMGLAIRVGQSVSQSPASTQDIFHMYFLLQIGLRTFNSHSLLSIVYGSHLFWLCLDRDSGRWNVGITETQRRRELFWEMFTYDSLQVSNKLQP